jgi:hypothetical protein
VLFVVAARLASQIGQSQTGEFRIDQQVSDNLPASRAGDYRVAGMERG